MSRLLISAFFVFYFLTLASAQEKVVVWLHRMQCNELIAVYLEDQLLHGDRNTKVRAAKQLANVYAQMLASADRQDDKDTLLKAISLFERIPEAGTVELRLQLYRATYLSAEQAMERFRFRLSDRVETDIAIVELQKVANEFRALRKTLQKKIKTSRSPKEKNKEQLDLATSYLAWSLYYAAWYEEDSAKATEAAQLFAEVLDGAKADLDQVSLDYRWYEVGARAILGIALCKAIIQDSEGPDPWFEELNDPETSNAVRKIVPLWRFFLYLDSKSWDKVLNSLDNSYGANQAVMCRAAAVHANENLSNPAARNVAEQSISTLIDIGQLGIVSDFINQFGNDLLPRNGFIANYLEGDIAFRKAKETFTSDTPPEDQKTRNTFFDVASMFNRALHANDADMYSSLVHDCQFKWGLCLFYSSQFEKAVIAFQQASDGAKKEQAIWMAIVNLDYIEQLSDEQRELKDELSELYIKNWPNTVRATELVLNRASFDTASPEAIEELLLIPHSDPKYEQAQRQASRSLYKMWLSAREVQRGTVGNKYISVALPLMIADSNQSDDLHATEVSSVRALRILEVALNPDVKRIVAARRAIDVLDEIQKRQGDSLQKFSNEILCRRVSLYLLENNLEQASSHFLEMNVCCPEDSWTRQAARELWSIFHSREHELPLLLRYAAGKQLLLGIETHQYASDLYLDIALKTSEAAFELYKQDSTEVVAAEDALSISRVLVAHKSDVAQVLVLSARVEMELGDSTLAKERWQLVVSGSQRGSLQWFMAKYNSILLLEQESAERALEVLEQHQILYPEYGQEPYGSKFRQLHDRLLKETNDGP